MRTLLFCLVIAICTRQVVSKAQEAITELPPPPIQHEHITHRPTQVPVYYDYDYSDYGAYDYKQTYDYVKHYDYDYGHNHFDHTPTYADYAAYGDYAAAYGDYGAAYGDYPSTTAVYGDYPSTTAVYADYGTYDYNYGYDDDYGGFYDDYTMDYGNFFSYGDRNNPYDMMMYSHDDSESSGMPWVYIIVPVVQVDVYYVTDEEHANGELDAIDLELPIETFLFELGDFGFGHFELGDFGLGDFGLLHYDDDYHVGADYMYTDYNDYPVYGNYQGSTAQRYDSAEELDDVLDYPGIDHDNPYWVDWIFMVPPEEQAAALVR